MSIAQQCVEMKNIYISLLFILYSCLSNKVYSQFHAPYNVGLSIGAAKMYADLSNRNIDPAANATIDVFLNPFLSIGGEGQAGKLSGSDEFSRWAINNFVTGNINIKVRAGQFIGPLNDYRKFQYDYGTFRHYLSYAYVGTGFGIIRNMIEAQRYNEFVDEFPAESFEGLNRNFEALIPLNIGIDIPLGTMFYKPTWAININYQFNFVLGNNVDGYNNSFSKNNDVYSYFSIGLKKALFERRRPW